MKSKEGIINNINKKERFKPRKEAPAFSSVLPLDVKLNLATLHSHRLDYMINTDELERFLFFIDCLCSPELGILNYSVLFKDKGCNKSYVVLKLHAASDEDVSNLNSVLNRIVKGLSWSEY